MRDMMEGRQTKNWVAMSYTHIFLVDILQVSQHTLAFSPARWEGEDIFLLEIGRDLRLRAPSLI